MSCRSAYLSHMTPCSRAKGRDLACKHCKLQFASQLPNPDFTPTTDQPIRIRPSLMPCSRSLPIQPRGSGPGPAPDYLTSGTCSAFSAALSRRSMALPPATGPRRRAGRCDYTQLAGPATSPGAPSRKCRQPPANAGSLNAARRRGAPR